MKGMANTFQPQFPFKGIVAAMAQMGFNPRTLFANNEPGVWYDPSDLSTLFQDAEGTTPVTAVEQPVGLMLDKSKGLVLGPELVTNGDFSDGLAGWSQTGTTWSAAGGTAKNDGTAGYLYKAAIVTVGTWVVVECTVADKGTAGSLSISLSNGGATASFSSASLVNGQRVSVRGVKTFNESVYFFGQGGWNGAIDNISVRELPGNHATQPTATSRPVLSARVNLLTKTEQFDDAVWVKNVVTVTPNTAIAPDGTLTADEVARNATGDASCISGATAVSSGASFAFSVYLKQSTARYAVIQLDSGSGAYFYADLQIGAVSQAPATYGATPPTSLSAAVVSIGNGWFRVVFSFTATSAVTTCWVKPITSGTGPGFNTADTVGASVFIWGADLRVANDGANLPPYQRVNTATDYDTVGFPHYLRFDGVDDGMVTNTITPGTDKVQVFAGVRKLRDAIGVIAELSDIWTNSGAFAIFDSASDKAGGRTLGMGVGPDAIVSVPEVLSPTTYVATGSISRDSGAATLRQNSTTVGSISTAGPGNFGNYPLYIGRRGGWTLPFNGRLYSLIVRFGSNLPVATIEQTEKYINQKTRAY